MTELQIYFDKPKIMVKRSWIRIVIEKIEPGLAPGTFIYLLQIFLEIKVIQQQTSLFALTDRVWQVSEAQTNWVNKNYRRMVEIVSFLSI